MIILCPAGQVLSALRQRAARLLVRGAEVLQVGGEGGRRFWSQEGMLSGHRGVQAEDQQWL